MSSATHWDIIVVGGGPAGLSAAMVAAKRPGTRVLVFEREEAAGGIPRHCDHTGWGLRDLRWSYSGPSYARRLTKLAVDAGVHILTDTTVRKVESSGEDRIVHTVSPRGIQSYTASAVILATGCRESTRHSLLLPGKRPLGVFNTGTLQQFVHLKRIVPGTVAVVFGSEHVAFSAVMTLNKAGMKIAAMVEPDGYPHSFLPVSWSFERWYGFRLLLNCRIVNIHGNHRLTGITVEDTTTNRRTDLACDTLIVSGAFKPEITLAVESNLPIDPAADSVLADSFLHTERKGIFACGNVLHGAETGDIAALEGRWAGVQAGRYLDNRLSEPRRVRIECAAPIAWISPGNVIAPILDIPSFLYTMRVTRRIRNATVVARFGDETVWKKRYGTLTPHRRIAVPVHTWTLGADPGRNDMIRLSIEEAA